MIIRLEEGTTVFDFALMVNGSLDNIYDFMSTYGIETLDENLTSREFDITFNTNSEIVNFLFLKSQRIRTGNESLFNELNDYKGEFNSDFNNDFNNL